MTLGGLVNGAVALSTGQFQKTHWTVSGASAIGYLMIFGSWIGYSAYIYLLEHVPTPKVATYAYVNPIVASHTRLAHSARARGCLHAGGDRDHHRVGGVGEHVEAETCTG